MGMERSRKISRGAVMLLKTPSTSSTLTCSDIEMFPLLPLLRHAVAATAATVYNSSASCSCYY